MRTPRSRTLAAAVLTLLASGLTVATPGTAQAARADWGQISRPDGVLRRGCHDYAYRYRFTPPEGAWGVEIFLIGPGGRGLAADRLDYGFDDLRGRRTLRICRANTRPGTFRIRGKMTIHDGPAEVQTGWLVPARFRLRRP